ncbi:envelope stress response protein PspG [Vibrio olivae]|uniref:Envelope stress response protein PspG n=1 Tax=Vibrio olivae TaxID=1243002 RepID=A0ABV5HSN9_9VIBR
MFEVIFVLVFVATLMVTGVTFVTLIAAAGFAFVVMSLVGMLGLALKLLPWILVVMVGVWFFKNYVYQPRG